MDFSKHVSRKFMFSDCSYKSTIYLFKFKAWYETIRVDALHRYCIWFCFFGFKRSWTMLLRLGGPSSTPVTAAVSKRSYVNMVISGRCDPCSVSYFPGILQERRLLPVPRRVRSYVMWTALFRAMSGISQKKLG
jgi:hypothetical protein